MQSTNLPQEIQNGIDTFIHHARDAFGDDLVSAVLFGSAAEDGLRSTSDVNLLLVLRKFEREKTDRVREYLRTCHAQMHLEVMFLLESEIEQAMDAFAVKFVDILMRRKVLFGPDHFANVVIAPEAILRRTQQVLLNLMLRMRERYALVSLREEQLPLIIADMTGPLRACAASLLKLEGKPARSPKEALAAIIAEHIGPGNADISGQIDTARREGTLPPGVAGSLMFALMDLAAHMHHRASGLASPMKGAARG